MAKIWAKQQKRFKLHARQHGLCPLCGEGLHLADATLDHILPKSRGGGGTIKNLQATHAACNNLKGNKIIVMPPAKNELRDLVWERMCRRPDEGDGRDGE